MNKKKTNFKGSFEPIVEKAIKQISAELQINYEYEPDKFTVSIPTSYTPDFRVDTKSGPVYVECKGYFRPESMAKVKAFVQENPEVKFHIIFQKDNPVYKGSKIKYSDWCKKLNISYSVSSLPKELFE